MLLQHLIRTLSFQILYQLTYSQMRGNGYKHMDVILRYMSLDNLYFMLLTYSTEQLTDTFGYYTTQYSFAIFCYPNYMILAIIRAMARLTIILHILFGNKGNN